MGNYRRSINFTKKYNTGFQIISLKDKVTNNIGSSIFEKLYSLR